MGRSTLGAFPGAIRVGGKYRDIRNPRTEAPFLPAGENGKKRSEQNLQGTHLQPGPRWLADPGAALKMDWGRRKFFLGI